MVGKAVFVLLLHWEFWYLLCLSLVGEDRVIEATTQSEHPESLTGGQLRGGFRRHDLASRKMSSPSPVTAPSPDNSSSSPPAPPSDPSSPPPSSPPPSPAPPPPSSSPPPSSPPPPPPSPPPTSPPPSDESSPPPPPPRPTNSSSSSAPSQSTLSPPSPPPPPKSSKSGSSNGPPLAPPQPNNVGDKPSPSSRSQKPSPGGGNDDAPAGTDLPVVIGVVAGITVFILIMLISLLVCCCNKKKKKKHVMHYYDPAAPKGNDNYYNNGGGGGGGGGAVPPKWQPQGDMKIPPPPGLLAMPPPGGGGWVPGPPAPLSGDMSSSNYSGPQPAALPPPSPNIALGFNKSTFTYDELAAATGGFSQSNLLGQGGFGYVYKGYLPNGKEVAVKQLKSGSGQGEKEFQAEVEIISRVHHRHLVSLVGYCIAGSQRMLVFEFVPNNTLEYHLHGKGLPTMTWPTRLKIAIGSAKGFAYLHEDCHPRIIHRDIKAANILLDYKFEAMVADFGLAKLSSDTNTHVSTRIMGTFGYLAPEYASSGKLTDRSDVFSFGVMLLELISGRRPVDHTCMDDNLVDWARPIMTEALAEGNFEEIADPKLEGSYSTPEMARMVACAAASVRHSAKRRPKMSQIVRALEGDGSLEDLHEGGVKPGQSVLFSSGSDCDMESYSSNMRQFRKAALGSGEYDGGDSGQATSEYGLNPSDSSGSSGEMPSETSRPHKPPPPRRQL